MMTGLQFILALVAAAAAAGLTSADSTSRTPCEPDWFYDNAAQLCTPCVDICDPARHTEYLCQQHVRVCYGKLASVCLINGPVSS